MQGRGPISWNRFVVWTGLAASLVATLACSSEESTAGDASVGDAGIRPDGGDETDAAVPVDAASGDGSDAQPPSPFAPNPRLSGLARGSVLDLGRFECEPVDGEDPDLCRRATDYSGFVYDPHRHRMLLFGGGHSTTMTDVVHALDLSGDLVWSGQYEPTPCSAMNAANLDDTNGAWLSGAGGPYPRPVSSHTYDMLAVPARRPELVVLSRNFTGGYCNPVGNDIGGRIAHYDFAAESWSFSPTASGSGYGLSTHLPGSEPDPISGDIVLLGRGGLSLYDPASRVLTEVTDTLRTESGEAIVLPGYANHLVYFPPSDTFYYFVRGTPVEVYSLVLDRDRPEQSVVERVSADGPTSAHGEPSYDYDSVHQIIGGGVQDSTLYAFDPRSGTWTAHPMSGGQPGNQAFHALAFDPVNGVFLFLTDYDSGQHAWAFRL